MSKESLPPEPQEEQLSFFGAEDDAAQEAHDDVSDVEALYCSYLSREPDANDARKEELLRAAKQSVVNRQHRKAYRKRAEERRKPLDDLS